MIASLLKYLQNKDKDVDSVPEGYCPNCWGRSDYGGKFYTTSKNYDVDLKSKNPQTGWVKEYADKHLSSIKLIKNKDNYVCQKCKLTYKEE